MNRIKQALLFAKEKHAGQKYGSHDYMYHLIRVVKVAQRYGASDDDIVACFLHDTIEDTSTTHNDIAKLFGQPTADVVELVSNRSTKEATFKRIRTNKRAVFVKLCDRIANCEEGAKNDKYRKEYPLFKKILYKSGEFEPMWKHLDNLLQ
jgi:(p)ppGpp synthase/HD superfamily hydrolase